MWEPVYPELVAAFERASAPAAGCALPAHFE
jgi:hypothetical protein